MDAFLAFAAAAFDYPLGLLLALLVGGFFATADLLPEAVEQTRSRDASKVADGSTEGPSAPEFAPRTAGGR